MIIKLKLLNIEHLKRLKNNKFSKKLKISKALTKNQNQPCAQLSYLNNLNIIKNKKIQKTKQNNACCFSGRIKAYYRNFRFGRHFLNKKAFEGTLQNTCLKS
jgi:ribosomal protein S14